MADLKQRPLAPFEKRLCRELGCTEEEYILFLDEMHSQMARRPIPGEAPQAGPVVSIVLAVVGLIFQVVGLLLRPAAPQRNQSTTTGPIGESASPVFGFTSVQDLARIGEIVPQIYCDRSTNPNGGVRVNGKLVWSQVESRGNYQEGKFLTILSYGNIKSINPTATAVGKAPLNTLNSTASWVYYTGANSTAPLLQNTTTQYLQSNSQNSTADPTAAAGPIYWVPKGTGRVPGTCQAYNPSVSNTFGITSAIPVENTVITLKVESNTGNEHKDRAPTYIVFDDNTRARIRNSGTATAIGVDSFRLVVFRVNQSDTSLGISASNIQRTKAVESFSAGTRYILGNTVWRAEPFTPEQNANVEAGNVVLNFKLIESFEEGRLASETGIIGTSFNPSFAGYFDRDNTLFNPVWRFFCSADFASYITLSKVDSVELSIRATVWGELSTSYRNDIQFNGNRSRVAAFRLRFRRAGTTSYTAVSSTFYVDRSSKTSTFFYIRLEFPTRDNWEIQLFPVVDLPLRSSNGFFRIDINEGASLIPVSDNVTKCYANGTAVNFSDVVGGFFQNAYWRKGTPYRGEQDARYSFESGPEFSIVAVNEIQYDTNQQNYYKDCALLGLNVFGGNARQDINQISAFVNQGRTISRYDFQNQGDRDSNGNLIIVRTNDSSNRFGDIFVNTLTGPNAGLGQYITTDMVDLESIALANRFTSRNGFYFDGVIDQEVSWRQWATETAGHSLLQVVTLNGKFGLKPVVPVRFETGAIDPVAYTIKALFNESNILEGSYTETLQSAEDSLPQLVTVRYRENSFNSSSDPNNLFDSGFPRERSVTFKLKDEGLETDKEVVVNCAGDVTNESQAKALATYLLCARRYEDRTIAFKTPEPWLGLAPNDIIRVDTQFTRFVNTFAGRIKADGTYDIIGFDGNIPANSVVLIYTPWAGTGIQTLSGSTFNPASYPNSLVAIGQNTTESRLFTITKIDIDEDGIAEINAKLFPVLPGGNQRASLVATALLQPDGYVVQINSGG